MTQGIVIYRAPVALDERTDEQQKCGLRLMKISDQLIDYLKFIPTIWNAYPGLIIICVSACKVS